MMSRRLLMLILAALVCAGAAEECERNGTGFTEPPDAPGRLVGTAGQETGKGLTDAERRAFYHLPEGSEIFPLAFALALEQNETGRPFLENPERFGLIPDEVSPENRYGLPIGIAVARAKDLRARMIGVNCAVCHVGEIRYQKYKVRIDGAPNLFNLSKFYKGLFEATEATLKSPAQLYAFMRRLHGVYGRRGGHARAAPRAMTPPGYPPPAGPGDDAATAALGEARRITAPATAPGPGADEAFAPEAGELELALYGPFPDAGPGEAQPLFLLFDDLDAMKAAGPYERHLAEALERDFAEEMAREPEDLYESLKPERTRFHRRYLEHFRQGDYQGLLGLVGQEPVIELPIERPTGEGSRAGQIRPENRRGAHRATRLNWKNTYRMLKARAIFLKALKDLPPHSTEPGFGRIDPFGGARDVVWPKEAIRARAPVSWPHIWKMETLEYYHRDANTTSLLERNVGQALGLGAIFDRQTYISSLIIPNIERLEVLAGKTATPVWPDAVFGAPDPIAACEGKAVFEKRCMGCHTRPSSETFALSVIGTDVRRAVDFAIPLKAGPFDQQLSAALKAIIWKAGGKTPGHMLWQTTQEYSVRPLQGVWATAPYLHNGAVPTVYDLLHPEGQRPDRFPVQSRHYDPERLGYYVRGGCRQDLFCLDTSLDGNSKAGHSGPRFGTDMPEKDRRALIEFLKVYGTRDPCGDAEDGGPGDAGG